jgi:serine/threonine protein kinase
MLYKCDAITLTQSGIIGSSNAYRLEPTSIVLKKEIGHGAYSNVYLGEWNNQVVAVKRMTYEEETLFWFLSVFKKERDLMQKLTEWQAPNIIRYYGFSHNNTTNPSELNCQIVMEYMENGSLAKFIGKHDITQIDWPLRYTMMHDMTRGIAFLHHVNILHGDIKVDNVLVDTNRRVKIGDLGTAKNPDLKKGNGTSFYQAPEQRGTGELPPYTDKADVYSLALMLWSTAFWIININVISQVRDSEKPPILDEECPMKVAKLITWGMAKHSEHRASAKELLAEFDLEGDGNGNGFFTP